MPIPAPLARRSTRTIPSQALLHWRPRDASLVCVSGQTLALTRAATRVGVDTNGASFTAVHSMPAWSARTLFDGVAYGGLTTGTADLLSTSVIPAPQTMSGVIDFVQDGDPGHTAGVATLLSIGGTVATDPFLTVYVQSTYYAVEYQPVSGGYGATVTRNATDLTKLVRLRWIWNANGSLQIGVSLNGGAETLGGTTPGITRVPWVTGSLVRINGTGWSAGMLGWVRSVKMFGGVQSLAQMDALV